MKLVFDTNVVVAGIVAEGLCREILEIHVPEHEVILSQVLWDELVATLRRKFGLAPDDLPILALYRQHSTWCEPAALAEAVCRDPDDDWVSGDGSGRRSRGDRERRCRPADPLELRGHRDTVATSVRESADAIASALSRGRASFACVGWGRGLPSEARSVTAWGPPSRYGGHPSPGS